MGEKEARGILLAEEAVQAYPALKAAYRELKAGAKGHRDPTADAALAELPPKEQRAYEAVQRTIRRTAMLSHGQERNLVIQLLYWQRQLTAEEAAEEMGLTTGLVEQYRQDFLQTVKVLMDISDCEGCRYYRYFTNKLKACHYCVETGRLRQKGDEDPLGICPHYEEKGEEDGSL